jgi:Trypsin-co-occurring domain 1
LASEIVSYQLDDSTVVRFEADCPPGFQPAGGSGRIVGAVSDAIAPAIEAAKVVLGKVKEAAPDEVEVSFGVKVTGGMDWLIARAASEANFEITLTWRPSRRETGDASDRAGREALVPQSPTSAPGDLSVPLAEVASVAELGSVAEGVGAGS